jgi:protein O-mannosyl-transferase
MNDTAIIKQRYIGIFLMVVLTCLVYANSFQASWHLDDYANIVYNKKLHLNELNYSSIVETFYANPRVNGRFYRPIACLTFALNWYAGQNEVFSYHLVNLWIHCLAAIILLKVVMLLFRTPMLSGHYQSSDAPYWIALLAATLWAVHPIQTQAVTYIVQRMASLAGLFYIFGIFCFLKGRLQAERSKAGFWYVGAMAAYLLAIGSKENAIIFPLALVLMEVALFRPSLFKSSRQRLTMATFISAVVIMGFMAVMLVSEETMTSLFPGYETRYFNHSQRLLTQFRILVHYFFQIGYPSPAHLSVDHDIIVSSGLLTPWTTLPAVILVFGMLWGLLYLIPKLPLISFGGLFFLLQHTVESSFLPLELIFEHRNYIPSMFLFTGIASVLYQLIGFYRDRSPLLHHFLALSSALIICFIGMGTYSRNADWLTEKSLWEDVLAKAPGSSRALHNIAWGYYEPIGETAKALALYQQAVNDEAHHKQSATTTIHNIGNIYYNQGDYDQAIAYLQRALDQNSQNIKTHLRLIYSHIALSEWDKADAAIEYLLSLGQRSNVICHLKGFLLLNKHQPGEALIWFRRARANGGFQWEALAGIGQSLHLLGYYEKSDFFLRSAQSLAPNKPFLILNRLDLYLDANQSKKAEAMADLFVRSVPAGELATVLNRLVNDSSLYPLQYHQIIPMIESALRRTLNAFEHNDKLIALKLG